MPNKVMLFPDLYREQGHWLPAVNLAKSLKDRGYNIGFMGIKDCESVITPYKGNLTIGSLFTPILEGIYPLGYTLENKLEPLDQRWKPQHLMSICRGELAGALAGSSLLIGGYFTALESLLLHRKHGIPIALLTTYLRHPDDDPASFAKTKLVYMQRAVAQSLMDQVTPGGKFSGTLDEFVQPLRDAKELIPCPKSFDLTDPDWNHTGNVFYVEPMVLRVPLDGSAPPTNASGVPQDKRIIFGTAGSQIQDYEFKARSFFKNLISMMKTSDMDKYRLVLAVGEKILAQLNVEYGVDRGKSTIPSNVHLFDWVSPLDILAEAEVVFMHGGLATIKEAIWEQVPMVVVPHGKDQLDNALRIRRGNLGVVSDVTDLSPSELRRLITVATTNSWQRSNVAKLRATFQAEDAPPTGLKKSITEIQKIVTP